jgi:translation initiation factor IF-3
LVIDSDGSQLGVMPTKEALAIARERGVDLVEVASKAKPPVCKIQDFGRAKFEIAKKQAEQKRVQRQKKQEVKEVKFRPKTDEHDYQHKLRRVQRFLGENNKAKVTIMFRGRERSHPEIAEETLMRVARDCQELGQIETMPRHEGRTMWLLLVPRKTKK